MVEKASFTLRNSSFRSDSVFLTLMQLIEGRGARWDISEDELSMEKLCDDVIVRTKTLFAELLKLQVMY